MSLKVMKAVWSAPISPPTSKLTLLALADWCDDSGGSLFASLQTIAKKVGVGRCQAQRIVRGFIEQGLLSVVANEFGGKPGMTPHYRLNIDLIEQMKREAATPTDSADATPTDSADATPTDSADATPTDSADATPTDSADATPTDSADATPTDSADAVEGSHGCIGGVAPMLQTDSASATQDVKNHQKNSQNNGQERARATRTPGHTEFLPEVNSQTLADWQEVRKAKRAGPITATVAKGLRAEAAKAGLELQRVVELCSENGWAGFKASWESVQREVGGGVETSSRARPMTAYEARLQQRSKTMDALCGRNRRQSFEDVDYTEGVGHDGKLTSG